MKALVLAGGYATRLWPITKEIPKPLLPIGRKTIIDHLIDKVLEVEEIEEIIVSINKRFAPDFEEWAKSKGCEKLKLNVEETFREEEKMGAIRALWTLIEEYPANDYLILAADNLFSLDLKHFVGFYKTVSKTVIALFDIGRLDIASRYANVTLDSGGRVRKMVEKPREPYSSLISTGIYAIPRESAKRIKEYLDEGNSPDAPGYFFSWLLNKEEIYGYIFEGYWFDIGSLDTYLDAFRKVVVDSYVSKDTIIEEGVKLRDPVIIEKGCRIRGPCEIGPHVYLGKGVELEKADIVDSVILDNTKIIGAEIRESIIGRWCLIEKVSFKKSIIGDCTKLTGK